MPPWNIEKISSLLGLDLSNNELTSKFLPNFGNHLIVSLNLSFNQLNGEVSLSLQSAKYNRSFLGSHGLCSKWDSRINLPKCHGGSHLQKCVIILLVLDIRVITVSMSIIIWLLLRRRKNTQVVKEVVADWKMTPFTPLDITKSDVLNNISEENIIVSGGSEKVYHVHLLALMVPPRIATAE